MSSVVERTVVLWCTMTHAWAVNAQKHKEVCEGVPCLEMTLAVRGREVLVLVVVVVVVVVVVEVVEVVVVVVVVLVVVIVLLIVEQ